MSTLLAADVTAGFDDETPARFEIPGLPRHWIRRDRLNSLLSSATQNRLTVVTGSPGAGKSVLLADWCRQHAEDRAAWLTLDSSDNDAEVFWNHVSAALRVGGDVRRRGRGRRAHGADDRPGEGTPRLVDLGHRVLVLDDFHHITNAAILNRITSLVGELPAHVSLVLVGQRILGAPLKRLQLRGAVTAIGNAELRFTVPEAAALAALVSGKYLSIEAVEALANRCEGWAAGLHLAATALADEDDPSPYVAGFSGASVPVADYLEHEMLLCRSPGVVRFFLQTSVLEELTPELCRSVTGRSDAGEILVWLANHNLFVLPVDHTAKRYRYHRLFADLLRSRLQREGGSLESEAHWKAAEWFGQNGDVRSAARHFALGGAFEQAFRLMFPSDVPVLTHDDRQSAITTAMADVTASDCEQDPARIYVLAAALLTADRPNEALALLRRLETLAVPEGDAAAWKGRVEFLWAMRAEQLADQSTSLDHCRAAEELMRSAGRLFVDGNASEEGSQTLLDAIDTTIADRLPLLSARSHSWLGEPEQAVTILKNRFGSCDRAMAAEPSLFAVMACRKGRLREAHRFAGKALGPEPEDADARKLAVLEAHLVLAEVLFERNELATAQEHLDVARTLCRSTGSTHLMGTVDVDLVRMMLAKQQPREALSRLWQLRHIEACSPPCGDVLRGFNHVEVGCRILIGDLEGVLRLARSNPSSDFYPETLARIDLFTGRPDRVLARLRLAPSNSLATEIRRLLLIACADAQRGDVLGAEERARRAIGRARPEGYVRPFVEEARLTLPILRSILGTGGDPYLTYLVNQAEQLVPESTASLSSTLIEPLTERERELLTYLATHLHLHEIAGRMYVSKNTVKTHVKAIYRKVGAASRAEAVAIARAQGIL